MDLAKLFDEVSAQKTKQKPKRTALVWDSNKSAFKKRILETKVKDDDWDFGEIDANSISSKKSFYSEWEETGLCYIIQPVHCACCGWQHDEHWGLFLREKYHGPSGGTRYTRLLRNVSQYTGLPREVITHEPVKAPLCDRCFAEDRPEQLELAIDMLSAKDIEGVVEGIAIVTERAREYRQVKDKLAKEYGDSLGPAVNTVEDEELVDRRELPRELDTIPHVDEVMNW